MIRHIIFLFLLITLLGCFNKRTLLSEEIKNINPYQIGQKLTFISSLDTVNTLEIRSIKEGQFPDGLGAFLNERKFVLAFGESKTFRDGFEKRILTVFASTDKAEEKVDFSFSLKDTYLKMRFVIFSDYLNRPIINLTTDFYSYDDVIHFKYYPNRKIPDNEIVEFFWSKSHGYVRLLQKDGVVWDLKKIE